VLSIREHEIEAAQRAGARAQVTSGLESLRTQYARTCAALDRSSIGERQIEAGST
jgi:hypothetical protein